MFDIVTLCVWLTYSCTEQPPTRSPHPSPEAQKQICSWPGVLGLCSAGRRAGKGTKARKSKLSEHILSQVRKQLFFQGKLKWIWESQAEFTVLELLSKLQLTLIKLLLDALFVKNKPKPQTNPPHSSRKPRSPKSALFSMISLPLKFLSGLPAHWLTPYPGHTGVWMLHLWHSDAPSICEQSRSSVLPSFLKRNLFVTSMIMACFGPAQVSAYTLVVQ